MAEAGRVYVSVGAKIDEFNRGMNTVQQKARNVGSRVGGAGKAMTKGITAPVMAAGAAALGLANKYASMGDRIGKTSTKLGVSTDALQEMEYWASQNGMEAKSLERAVGRLNQRIGRAADGNEKYAEAFGAVDVALHDTQGNLRDTEDVMYDTIEALRDIEDPAARSAAASEIFGTKMARDLMPALEDSSLSLEEAAEKVHELGGVMDEEAVKAAENYEDSMDDLKRSFSGVWMELANKFIPIITEDLIPAIQNHVLPILRDFADRIVGLIEWFQQLPSSVQRTIGAITGIAVAAGPVLMVLGKLISVGAPVIGMIGRFVGIAARIFPIISKVVGAFKAKGAAIALLSNPIGWIIGAIAGLIALFVHLYNTNEDFRDRVLAIWEQIKEAGAEIWEALQETISVVVEAIRVIVEGVVKTINKLWEQYGDQLQAIIDAVWNQIALIIETVISLISNTIQFFLAIIRGDWSAAWEALKNIGESIWNLIAGTIENIAQIMANSLAVTWDLIKRTAERLWDSIREGVIQRATALRDGVIETVNAALEWIRELPSRALEWGRDIIQGLIDGIAGMASRLAQAVSDTVSNAVDGVTDFFSFGSPSKLMRDYGVDAIEGMVQGVNRSAGRLERAFSGAVNPVVDMRGMAAAGGGQNVTINANYNVTDKQTAEQANKDLVKKLQGRGVVKSYL